MMEFLKKVQKLSERKRKMIFWVLISILAIILTIFYIKISKERIENIDIEEIQSEFPKWEPEKFVPEFEEFDLPKKLEELKKLENVIE